MDQIIDKFKDDFALWAVTCVKVRHKLTGQLVPFALNRPQLKVLEVMERQRRAGLPIRVILLKARQWGGSTLVTLYMAWIQMIHCRNWHSLVCAHFKDAGTVIRNLYQQMVDSYPPHLLPEGCELRAFDGSRSVRELRERGCRITVCSAENVDAARGADYAMAHLSEVAFWADTPSKKADDLVRAICGSVPRVPNSLIVMESTANGRGQNFFYREWQRAIEGKSDKEAVFVAWFEIEFYREPLRFAPEKLLAMLTPYERDLLETHHLDLEQIQWYHFKALEYSSQEQMSAEFPSTAAEAFASNQHAVFDARQVEAMRSGVCKAPIRMLYNLERGTLTESSQGTVEVWHRPCAGNQLQGPHSYITTVDVGGHWEGADWSVVAVFDARDRHRLELVAQWRGHVEDDTLCRIAVGISSYYHNALLVVESNSLESRSLGVLERVANDGYTNFYRRRSLDRVSGREEERYGFHTNVSTKSAAIVDLQILLRDGLLIEHSLSALEEIAAYQHHPDGTCGAPIGSHDDLVMTRAIAAYVHRQLPPQKNTDFALR